MRTLLTLVIAGTLLAGHAHALRAQIPMGPEELAFDRADRRSRNLIATILCGQRVAEARERGIFGPVDSLGQRGVCIVQDGRFVGVFLDVDSQMVRPTRVSAIDIGPGTRRTAPLDTAAVLAQVRALDTALALGMPAFEKESRQFAPFTLRVDGDSVEVWLVPVAVLMGRPFTLGGERGYVFSPDGRTLARAIDASADFRTIAVPDTGTVTIVSRSTTVPTLSEFTLANGLNQAGRNVAIVTSRRTSVLVGRGAQAMWMQVDNRR